MTRRAWKPSVSLARQQHRTPANAAWNIERHDHEANYGGRVIGTTLRRSDYAVMARALGTHAERVVKPEEMIPAFKRVLANAPVVVDVVTSQAAVTSEAQKGLGNVPDYQARTIWDEAEKRRCSKNPT